MANSSVKKKKKNKVIYLCLFGFLIYFVYTLFQQQLQLDKYNSQIKMYESEIEAKESLVNYYSNEKDNIDSDEYIEQVARDVLGYVKPYEKVFIDANK